MPSARESWCVRRFRCGRSIGGRAGRAMRTIWLAEDRRAVEIIDQRLLPHELVIRRLTTLDDAARAIRDMEVRGAPLIGATAAYGMALGMAEDTSDRGIEHAAETL